VTLHILFWIFHAAGDFAKPFARVKLTFTGDVLQA